MAKAKVVSVQGFTGQQPINQKVTQIGVAGFDHVNMESNKMVEETLAYLNWEESHSIVRNGKLKDVIRSISTLTKDAQIAYRKKLLTITAVTKEAPDSLKEAAAKAGYTENSYRAMLSNFAAFSKAFQAGWAYDAELGWTDALKVARDYTKMQAMKDGGKIETKGRKVRVEMPVVDKIMALIAELQDDEMIEFTEKLTSTYTIKGI